MTEEALRCPYCGAEPKLVGAQDIYPRRADLVGKAFYVCRRCDAWVGCHPGTTRPLGRLADAALRRAKMRVHAVLDPHWQHATERRGRARGDAYARLAAELGIPGSECHVGMFDLETCARAEAIVRGWSVLGHTVQPYDAQPPI